MLGNGNSRIKEKETQGAGHSQGPATIHYGPHIGKARSGGRRKAKEHRKLSPITDSIDFQSRSDGTVLFTIICLVVQLSFSGTRISDVLYPRVNTMLVHYGTVVYIDFTEALPAL